MPDTLNPVRIGDQLRPPMQQCITDIQMPWADVKKEMTVDKGLDEAVADKIGEYVGLKGMSFVSR